MIKKLIAALAAGIFMLTIAGIVYATPITINTLTFTEVSAGVNITGGSGTGSKADPIIFNEDVSGNDVTIKIEGLANFTSQVVPMWPVFFFKRMLQTTQG